MSRSQTSQSRGSGWRRRMTYRTQATGGTTSAGDQLVEAPRDLVNFAAVIAGAWWRRPGCEIKTRRSQGGQCNNPARYRVVCHECGRGLVCTFHLNLFLAQFDATRCNKCGRIFGSINDAITVVKL